MALIPNLQTTHFVANANLRTTLFQTNADLQTTLFETKPDGTVPSRPQAMVDTPQHRLTDWFNACGAPTKPLGRFPKGFRIGVIGGGAAGVLAAYEAVKAGAEVTLIEMLLDVGGRARSVKMEGKSVGEQGCMRFPPSEALLYLLAKAFGYGFIKNFPDPGVVPTLISYGGECQYWTNAAGTPPKGFETVTAGWGALVDDGCIVNRKTFISPKIMAKWLQSEAKPVRMQARQAWQDYIDEFKYDTFLDGMKKIFSKTNATPPAGKTWSDDDFSRFGKLGIGSGGFGAFYSQCFLTIWRFIPNLWETDQSTFAKIVKGEAVPAGIRELWRSIWEKATHLGLKSLLNTRATAVSKREASGCGGSNPIYTVTVENADGVTDLEFDEVFINLTTNVARNLNLGRKEPDQIFPDATCDAINEVHMAKTTKLFVTVPRHKYFDDPKFPRVLLTDGDLPQLYCLDYGDPDNLAVMVVYAWEGYSEHLEAVKDPKELFKYLKALAAKAVASSEYPRWADCLQPVGDKIELMHWQDDPAAQGAFTFALPGQDRLCAALFYDFEKRGGPYLIGDSASFGGGWVEPALESAATCFSAMLKKHGKLNHPELAPVNLLSSSTYTY